jgi:translation initiation factor IF-2
MARFSKVIKDLNIGKQRALDFLEKKGLPVEDDLNAKLTDEQVDLLTTEFARDKNIKQETEKRQAERQERHERMQAEKEKEKKAKEPEMVETVVPEEAKPRFTTIGKIDLDEVSGKKKAAKPAEKKEKPASKTVEKPKAKAPEEAKTQDTPSTEESKEADKPKEEVAVDRANESAVEATAAATEAYNKKLEEATEPTEQASEELESIDETEEVDEAEEAAEEEEEEKKEEIFEFDHSDLQMKPLTVLGKVDLSAINQSTRPKKKTKEEKKKEREEKEKARQEQRKQIKENILKDIRKDSTAKSTGETQKKKRNRIGGSERVDINKAGAAVGGSSSSNNNGKREDRRGKSAERDRDRARRILEKNELNEGDVSKQVKDTLARLTNKQKSTSAKYRKEKREQAFNRQMEQMAEEEAGSKVLKLTEFVTANELASMMNVGVAQVIGTCMSVGIMVSINQRLDAETINLVASEFGFTTEFVSADVAKAVTEEADDEADLLPRAPIVTVMGHVDHGKTSLLDYIRKSNVIAGEAGGITQHIGAYNVKLEDGRHITFLDTPGHEAFTAMRARGAQVTDIAIIIVAADDDVMPQTKEAISHAQAAGVPMVFAINKIDKPHADPEKIKGQLAQMNLLVEDWGGKYQSQDISAKQGIGVEELLEKVLLEAEMLELKANPNRKATGSVIESTLDKGRGYVATLLVSNGTLKMGDVVLAGTHYGRIKAMFNERGQRVKKAGPSEPVLILGLNGAPQAGDSFHVFDSEQEARAIATDREQLQREQGLRTQKRKTLEDIGRDIAKGGVQELNIIVKGDVDGSIEALSDSLIKLSTEKIQVNVIYKAVGQISESDVQLAAASQAFIVGFQVRPSQGARKVAENEGVDIRLYSIIYDAIEEVKAAMEGMLAPVVKEEVTSTIEVREVFHISKVGFVAGAMVKEGKVKRSDKARLIRDGIVIYTGDINALKRFKDDVKEVGTNFECGISLVNCNDIKVGDLIETFQQIEVKQTL